MNAKRVTKEAVIQSTPEIDAGSTSELFSLGLRMKLKIESILDNHQKTPTWKGFKKQEYLRNQNED